MLMASALIFFIAKYVFTKSSYIDSSKRQESAHIMWIIGAGKTLSWWLTEFRMTYGSYPDVETAKRFAEQTEGWPRQNGDTSNDYFRQLFASGIAKSEKPFHVKPPHPEDEPDGNTSGFEVLKAGEVEYGYVMNGNRAISPDNPERVILVAPLLQGGKADEFDKTAMFGFAVLVCCDGRVLIRRISGDNKVQMPGGRGLLETGEGTMWGTDITPVIKLPMERCARP
jgi:hypothetical protein